MTPKEKAIELIRKFYSVGAVECKQCALIAVDEVIEAIKNQPYGLHYLNEAEYWEQVKQEIELL